MQRRPTTEQCQYDKCHPPLTVDSTTPTTRCTALATITVQYDHEHYTVAVTGEDTEHMTTDHHTVTLSYEIQQLSTTSDSESITNE